MSVNDIYTYLMEYEYEIARNTVIVLIVVFIIFVVIDVLKWRYYGKK